MNKLRRIKQSFFRNKKQIECFYCEIPLSFKNATVEHLIPRSNGGADVKKNCTIACQVCNSYRQSIPSNQWCPVAKFAWYKRIIKGLKSTNRISSFINHSPDEIFLKADYRDNNDIIF